MNKLFALILAPASPTVWQLAWNFLRIGIGLLTIGHGAPKMLGGIATWQFLGSAMHNIGIHWLPLFWGIIAASTEFFGGIALTLGCGTRIASFLLTIMMIMAYLWHRQQHDPFSSYSFPLTMIVVFIAFLIAGAGNFSLDYYFTKKQYF